MNLNMKNITLSIILSMTLMSGLSLAQNETDSVETSLDDLVEAKAPSMEGIWIFPMDDAQVTMVLYQSEDLLFGACTSEDPEPWNAVVMGSLEEDSAMLNVVSPRSGVMVSMKISGTVSDDTFTGSFVQADSNGNVEMGEVLGFQASPETAGYEPAEVAACGASALPAATTTAASSATETTSEIVTTVSESETTKDQNKPVDVTNLADSIGSAAFIPPGMG